MQNLLDPEAYGFANPDEDRRKKLSAQDVMSALGGLLSQPVDYVKGRATSLLTDPIGDIQKTLQGTVERARARDLLTQQAYGDPKNPLRVTDQAAADQLANEYLDMASTIMPAGMMVYHGSPYKFGAFDSTKIGSGEGAQAYGYGHYVAESPDVARVYSADRAYVGASMSGKPVAINYDDPKWIAQKTIDEIGDVAKATEHLKMVQRTAGKHQSAKTKAAVQGAIDLISSGEVVSKGNLYKVDLPDDQIAKMLDWDKPFSEQPKAIQDALNSYADLIAKESNAQRLLLNKQNPERLTHPVIGKLANKKAEAINVSGSKLYEKLSQELGSPANVSEFLRAQGIPGIRYLDEGSRGVGSGTSNFVVFPGNEGLLNILERNNQPLTNLLD